MATAIAAPTNLLALFAAVLALALTRTHDARAQAQPAQAPQTSTVDVPGDTWLTAEQAARMERKKLGFVCDGEPRDPATRDALYDRD
jgi:hypothetical protein